MSYKATNWAYELPLRGSMKPVLVALADMADEEHSCFPSQARLASMTGLGVRTVRRAVDELEQAGLLRREPRYGGMHGRKSDRYVLAVGESLPANLTGGQFDRRPESPSLPANLTISTGHSGQGNHQEPLLNHQDGEHSDGEVIESDDVPEGTATAKTLPDPFILTRQMKEWGASKVPGLDLPAETREFVAYWRHGEGRGKKKKNWVLTWRNWMKNQHSRLPASERTERRVKRLR